MRFSLVFVTMQTSNIDTSMAHAMVHCKYRKKG